MHAENVGPRGHGRTGGPLGDETLRERLESTVGRTLKPQKRDPKRKQENYVLCPSLKFKPVVNSFDSVETIGSP